MYKKYIIKRGKKIGPYYYTSKRINGKVKTVYLGSNPFNLLKKNVDEKNLFRKNVHEKMKSVNGKEHSKFIKPKLKPEIKIPKIKETVIGLDKGEFNREIVKLQDNLNFEKRGTGFNKILALIVIALILVTGGVFLWNYNGITGFVVKENSYSDNLNLFVSESSNYTWVPENKGELSSLKISGEVIGDGDVKVYLNNFEHLIYSNEEGFSIMNDITGMAVGFGIQPVNESNLTELVEIVNESFDNVSLLENLTEVIENVTINESVEVINESLVEEIDGKIKKFNSRCSATCSLSGFNSNNYTFIIIMDGASLNLTSVDYEIEVKEKKAEEGIIVLNKNGVKLNYTKIELGAVTTIKVNDFIDRLEFNKLENEEIKVKEIKSMIAPKNVSFSKIYSYELSKTNFSSGYLYGNLSNGKLYECKNFEFELDLCLSNWKEIKNITGEYSVELEKKAKGYAEVLEFGLENLSKVTNATANFSNATLNFSYEAKEGFGLGEIRTGNWHIRKSGLMNYAEIEALDKVKAGDNRFRIRFNKEFVDELEDSIKNNYDMNEFCMDKDIEEECGKVKSLVELKKLPVKGKNVEVNKNEIEIKKEGFGISSEEEIIVNLTEKGVSEGGSFSIGYATALIEEEAYWDLHNENNHWYISKTGFWLLNNLSDTWVNGKGVYHFSDKDVSTDECLWDWVNSSSEELIELSGSCEKDGKVLEMVWSLRNSDEEVKIEFKNADWYSAKQYNIQITNGNPENDVIVFANETRFLNASGEFIYNDINNKYFYIKDSISELYIYTYWESDNYKVNVSKQDFYNAEVDLEMYDNGIWYWVDQATDDSVIMSADPINEGEWSELQLIADIARNHGSITIHTRADSTIISASCGGGAKFRVAGRRWVITKGIAANNSDGYSIDYNENGNNAVNQEFYWKLVACSGSGGSQYIMDNECAPGTCTFDATDTLNVNAILNNAPVVEINFPKNNTLTTSHKINYTYNVSDSDSGDGGIISNCSLFLFKDNTWGLNATNTTGISEVSNMTINITMKDETVKWKVGCYDKGTKQGNSSAFNISVYTPEPSVELIWPANGADVGAIQQVNLTYNATTNDGAIGNCTLWIDTTEKNSTDTSIELGVNQTFNITFGEGTFNWKVECVMAAFNTKANSSEWSFTRNDGYCNGEYFSGNWNINSNVVCGNETIPVNGNISINTGGNLTLYNVTINFSMLKNGSNFINKTENGGLWIYDNFRNGTGDEGDASWITGNDSELYYDFYVFGKGKNGNFSMMHSKVTQAGYLTAGACGTPESCGVYLNRVNNSVIYKNNISNGARYGLYLSRSGQNNISSNFVNTTGSDGYGIFLSLKSNSNTLQSNTITTNGSTGFGIHLSLSSNSNITSNTITTTGSSGYGIWLDPGSNSNTLQSNTITTSNTDGYGIYLFSSSNSNITSNTITTSGSSGYGIYISLSSNNNATKNRINATGSNADGIFIQSDSDNNIIYKNNITESGRDGVSIQPSGANKPTGNNITKNIIFNSTKDGIAVIHSDNIIEYNTINYSKGYGINVSHNDINITGNTIVNGSSYGIYVNSSNAIIYRNKIENNTNYGIFVGKTNNTNISKNMIRKNIGYDIFVENSTDFILDDNSSSLALNTSFYKVKIRNFGNLTVQYYMRVNVTDDDALELNNINITANYNTTSYNWSKLSVSGYTSWYIQNAYVRNSSNNMNRTNYNPYNISGWDLTTYDNNETSVNLLRSQTVWLTLPAVFTDYCGGSYRNKAGSVDNWNINSNVVCGNETILVDGNISINSGGNLTLYNVTINFSMLKDGSSYINKTRDGGLWIYDNFRNGTGNEEDASLIMSNDSKFEYDFWVYGYGKDDNFSLRHSKVRDAGYLSKSQGIQLYNVSNVVIYQNNISDGAQYGLYLRYSKNNNISNNTIKTSEIDGIGIYLDSSSNSNITSNTITTSGSIVTIGSVGIYLYSSSNSNTLQSNKITTTGYYGYGIFLQVNSNSTLQNNNITTIDDFAYGIYLSTNSNSNITSNTITTNGSNGFGIFLASSSNSNTLQSNTITTSNTNGYGIYLVTSSNSILQNNTITTTGNSGLGIWLDSSSNSNITSNTITTTEGFGYGIWLSSSLNSNITNNTITTNGNDGLGIYLQSSSNSNILQSNTITTNGSDGDGIYLDPSSKNNVTKNRINATGSNADGVFIYRNSDDNIIYKNNITESGRDGVSVQPLGANKPTNNNITKNLIFNSTMDGIAVSHSDNIIEYNTINYSKGYGINVSHNDINITGNTIVNGSSYGIYVNSSRVLIYRNRIENNSVGVNLTRARGINLTNNTFKDNLIYDIEANQNSTVISLNNSLTKSKVFIPSIANDRSNLTMKWFLYVNATDNKTNPSGLNDVNVTIYDNSTGDLTAITLSRQTDTSGRTGLFEIFEYIQNQSGNLTDYMPLNVSGIGNSSYSTNGTKKFFGRSLPLFSLTLGTKGPAVLASYCNGNYVDHEGIADNWNINSNVVCGNETIPVDGNISVNSGGNLTLYNVTINFSMTKIGSNYLNKTRDGGLWIFDNFRNGTGDEEEASWITSNDSNFEYDFLVYGHGKNDNFSMMYSKVTDAGYSVACSQFGDQSSCGVYSGCNWIGVCFGTGIRSGGLQLYNVSNTVVSGNNISEGAYYGLYLQYSTNNNLTNNIITTTGNTGYGIYLTSSSNLNTLQSNTITTNGSFGYGIYLTSSSNSNTLQSNTITTTDVSGYGIYLTSSSNSNTLQSNTITTSGSDGLGIYLTSSSNSNTLQSNTITTTGGGFAYGIYLTSSSNSNITSNTITTNGTFGYGIHLITSSNSNTLQSNTITTTGSSGYGVYLYSSSKINATKNKINATGSNADGVFIYQNSDNNIIYKNNITESGRDGISIQPIGANKPTGNNITKNIIFNSTKDGIAVSEQKNIIEYNIINRSRNYGINVSHQKINITGNIIYNSTSYGIYVNSSNTLILRNRIENTTGAGIYLGWKSKNTRIILNNITRNFIGVNITNATGINLTNNSFIQNTIYDIELSGSSNVISLNNSLDKSKVKVFASGGKYSNLSMKWFLQVNASDNASNALNNINVSVYYNSSIVTTTTSVSSMSKYWNISVGEALYSTAWYDSDKDGKADSVVAGGIGDLFSYNFSGKNVWNYTLVFGDKVHKIVVFDNGSGYNETMFSIIEQFTLVEILDSTGKNLVNISLGGGNVVKDAFPIDADRDGDVNELLFIDSNLISLNASLWYPNGSIIRSVIIATDDVQVNYIDSDVGDINGDGFRDEFVIRYQRVVAGEIKVGVYNISLSNIFDTLISSINNYAVESMQLGGDVGEEIVFVNGSTGNLNIYNSTGGKKYSGLTGNWDIHEIRYIFFDEQDAFIRVQGGGVFNISIINRTGNFLWEDELNDTGTAYSYSIAVGDYDNDGNDDYAVGYSDTTTKSNSKIIVYNSSGNNIFNYTVNNTIGQVTYKGAMETIPKGDWFTGAGVLFASQEGELGILTTDATTTSSQQSWIAAYSENTTSTGVTNLREITEYVQNQSGNDTSNNSLLYMPLNITGVDAETYTPNYTAIQSFGRSWPLYELILPTAAAEANNAPSVANVWPANNSEWNQSLITNMNFTYNVSDTDSGNNGVIDSCRLYFAKGTNIATFSINMTNTTGILENVNQTFNVTGIDNGDYSWFAGCNDTAGLAANSSAFNISFYTSAAVNQQPVIVSVNITSNTSIAYTNTTLNCTFNVTDDSASFWANVTWWNGSVNWNGDDQLKTPLTTGQNTTTNETGNLEGSDISKNEVWKCEVRVWDSGGLVKRMNSTTITIKNSRPHNNITLLAPINGSSATNRTPLYTWTTAYDEDGDSIQYNITVDDNVEFTSPDINATSNPNQASYSVKKALILDTKLYWKVKAFDGDNFTAWSGLFEHTVDSSVILTMINKTVDFGSVTSGSSDDTIDNDPPPFWMQNDGNAFLNVTVNTTQQLWKQQSLGTRYFQYNVSDTNESLSYNRSMSNTTKWQNVSSGLTGFAVALLNYSDRADSAALNIRIEVPTDEVAGDKQSNLTFYAELTSLTKR